MKLTLLPDAGDRIDIITSTEMMRISSGDWAALYAEKISGTSKDLSHVWRVQLGVLTERLHGKWHGRQTETQVTAAPACPHTGRGIPCRVAGSKAPAWAASSYDFIVTENGNDELLEVKHTNAANDLRRAASYYAAQLQWQMLVANVSTIRFSIIKGNEEPEWGLVEADPDIQARLVQLATDFRWHLTNKEAPEDTPPDALVAEAAPKQIINGLKPYDYATNNEWVVKAQAYATLKPSADAFKVAEKELRGLIPADASEIAGGGITAKRDARGAYRITIAKEN